MMNDEYSCNLSFADVFKKTKAFKNCKKDELYIIAFDNELELKALLIEYKSELLVTSKS